MTMQTDLKNFGTIQQLTDALQFKTTNIHYSEHDQINGSLATVSIAFGLPDDDLFTTSFAPGVFRSLSVNFTDYSSPRVALFDFPADGEPVHVNLGADYVQQKCWSLIEKALCYTMPVYTINES